MKNKTEKTLAILKFLSIGFITFCVVAVVFHIILNNK